MTPTLVPGCPDAPGGPGNPGGPFEEKRRHLKDPKKVLFEKWCLKLLEVLTMSGMLRISCGENEWVHYRFYSVLFLLKCQLKKMLYIFTVVVFRLSWLPSRTRLTL